MAVYTSIDQLIGNTPLLELSNIEKNLDLKAKVLVKLEYFNPAGSVKDRIAKAMLDDAEAAGKLNKDSVIIEPTSGNTGVGLASVAAARGYRLIITMPETMSVERRLLMKAYGAELVLTDGAKGMKGAIAKAEELTAEIPNSFIAGQFTNPANPQAHIKTTGPEIWNDTEGKVDVFVAGVGTGGTVTGVGKYLKSQNPDVKVVAVEPASSPVLSKGTAGAHKIQGIGAGFVPDTLDTSVYDEVIAVENVDAGSTTITVTSADGTARNVALQTTDELMGVYDGICGVKTGTTDDAGYCFAGAVSRDAGELYSVVLDSPSSDERFSDTVALMDWAYANIAQRSLVNSDQYVEYLGAHVPLVAKVAHNDWVDVAVDATVADPDLAANVFAAFGPVQAKATFNELSGDVHAGDVIGSLVFMQDDNQIAQTDIIAAEDVAAPNFFQGIGVGFDRWIRSIQHQPTVAETQECYYTQALSDR